MESGYGEALVNNFPLTTGKVHVVAPSGITEQDRIQDILKYDADGVPRIHSDIDTALSNCSDNGNDVILVAPGHSETISDSTTFQVDVAGVTIIGLGNGEDRPTFSIDNTSGTYEIDSAGVTIKNCIFRAAVSGITNGFNVDAADFTMKDCKVDFNTSGDDFIQIMDIDAVDRAKVLDCEFITEEAAGTNTGIRLDDCDDVEIKRSKFYGQFDSEVILGEDSAGKGLMIEKNSIYNSDADTDAELIDLNVAFTGLMSFNSMGTLHADNPEDAVDPGSLLCNENYVCNAVDESGALVPTTVST